MTFTLAALLLAVTATTPVPEQCRVIDDPDHAVSVTHDGRTYRLASDECAAQFRSDPERYAQLYDTLDELERSGRAVTARPASLVPS